MWSRPFVLKNRRGLWLWIVIPHQLSDCSRPEWIWGVAAIFSSILFMSCKSWRLNLTNWEIATPTLLKAIRRIQSNVNLGTKLTTDILIDSVGAACFVMATFGLSWQIRKVCLPTGSSCKVQFAFSSGHKAHIYGALGPRYGALKMMAPSIQQMNFRFLGSWGPFSVHWISRQQIWTNANNPSEYMIPTPPLSSWLYAYMHHGHMN